LKEGCVEACNGCSYRYFSVEDGALKKLQWLSKRLEQWADKIKPVNHLEEGKQFGYREKVSLSTKFDEHKWDIGMWNRDAFIPIPDCPVHSTRVNAVIRILSGSLPPHEKFPLHFLFVTEKQLTLVLKTKSEVKTDWCTDQLKMQLEKTGAEALWLHYNPSAGHRMFEKTPWKLLWGKEYSTDYNGFRYGPTSFHQLIPELYQHSLTEAVNFLLPDENSLVLDLYCGNGNSLKHWSNSGAAIIGVESGEEAVKFARQNVPEALVLRGQCHTRIGQLMDIIKENKFLEKRRLLYVNPPRTGLGEIVTEWILNKYKPEKIGYLSCSAGTLNRDLEILTQTDYRVEKILPYDFFPNSHHVESLVLLS
jgi:23S rRNA (uracil1939-C5)-methyltransferase